MTSEEFGRRYRLVERISSSEVQSFRAQHVATGRAVMTHFIGEVSVARNRVLLDGVRRLLAADATGIVEAVDVEPSFAVVTELLSPFSSFPAWLDARLAVVDSAATAAPRPARESARRGAADGSGEFTRVFGAAARSATPGGTQDRATAFGLDGAAELAPVFRPPPTPRDDPLSVPAPPLIVRFPAAPPVPPAGPGSPASATTERSSPDSSSPPAAGLGTAVFGLPTSPVAARGSIPPPGPAAAPPPSPPLPTEPAPPGAYTRITGPRRPDAILPDRASTGDTAAPAAVVPHAAPPPAPPPPAPPPPAPPPPAAQQRSVLPLLVTLNVLALVAIALVLYVVLRPSG